jgi:hypothetical protein
VVLADSVLPIVLGCGDERRGTDSEGSGEWVANPSAVARRHILRKGPTQPGTIHVFSPLRVFELLDDEAGAATVIGSAAVLLRVLLSTAFSGPGSQRLVSMGTSDSEDRINVFRNGSKIPKVGNSPIQVNFSPTGQTADNEFRG